MRLFQSYIWLLMDKEKLKNIANDPNNISGIYNYCDRWCERCSFTSRCANYALGNSELEDNEILDVQNEKFWHKLGEIMQLTIEMVHEFAEEEGINLEAMDTELYREHEEQLNRKVDQFEGTQKSKKYVEIANIWLTDNSDLLDEKVDALQELQDIGIPESIDDLYDISDILEVIQWYKPQIQVKIMRAKRSKYDEFYDEEEDFLKDSDGSAKVALIGIDRSISAWGKMLEFFPQKEDELLEILVTLEQLRRQIEAEFPEARSFVRPGFDE